MSAETFDPTAATGAANGSASGAGNGAKPPNGAGGDDGWDDDPFGGGPDPTKNANNPQGQAQSSLDEKLGGIEYDGRYYARTSDGRVVDTGGRPLPPDIEKLLRKSPSEEPIFDLGERDFGAANISATELPPRGWLLGNWLCRQFVSALIADGAAGKTATRLACALAVAANRDDIVGEHVFERVPVLFLCFEDGETELKRRICAAMLEHGINNEDIKGYLFVRAITNSELKLAIANDYNKVERGPLRAALDAAIIRRNAGAVFLDPLVKTHAVNENSNKDMDLVIEILADLAIERDVAVDTPHHVSKGAADPGNADRGRGASAVKDGGRLVYTLSGMSKDEATLFDLDEDERAQLVRIDQAKINLIRRSTEAKWLRLVSVPLGNTWDPRYPSGNSVQTVKCWSPPSTCDGLTKTAIAEIIAKLRTGPEPGEFYSRRSNATHWVGYVISGIAGTSDAGTKRIIAAWIKNEVLTDGKYTSPNDHKPHTRVTVNEAKAIEILGQLYRPPGKPAPGKEQGGDAPPPEAPKNDSPTGRDKHDVLDQIFSAIERGLPPNGDGVVRYYSAEFTSERTAWRVVNAHRPDLRDTQAQAMVKGWIKNGLFLPGEDGLRLSTLAKQVRGIGE